MTAPRFSPKVYAELHAAGWYWGRNVLGELKLPKELHLFPAAATILAEFGGLIIGERKEEDRSGIDFACTDLNVSPDRYRMSYAGVRYFSEKLGMALYPIALFDHNNFDLMVDELGRVYTLCHNLDSFALSFEAALENLLHGKHGGMQALGNGMKCIEWPSDDVLDTYEE